MGFNEGQRAALSAAATKRQAVARRDRARRLKGSTAARVALGQRWAPLTRHGHVVIPDPSLLPPRPAPTDVDFFQGEGPPGDVPGAGPGDTYLDTLTGDLYEMEG